MQHGLCDYEMTHSVGNTPRRSYIGKGRCLRPTLYEYVKAILFALQGKYRNMVLPTSCSCHCPSTTSEHSQCRLQEFAVSNIPHVTGDFQILSKQETT
jgi:hypothetical protein